MKYLVFILLFITVSGYSQGYQGENSAASLLKPNQHRKTITPSTNRIFVLGTRSGLTTPSYLSILDSTAIVAAGLQQFSHASNSTTHTLSLTNSSSTSLQYAEGTGINLVSTGTTGVGAGILTINNTGVLSISGTTDRITVTGTTTPTIDIASTYVGQTSLTTLGTISTGVWSGTDILFSRLAQIGANTVVANPSTGTADMSTVALSASNLLGRGSTGNVAAITLSGGLSMSGTVLSSTSGTVTSITVTGANGIGVTGSPITSSGTIALSLGAITPTSIVSSGAISGTNLSGTNTGDQTITLTSDVTGSGTGSFATTISAGAVTLAKMANLAANSIIGNNTGISATPIALTAAQTKTLLSLDLVENTALSTWAGSTNLVTLGTVTTGTWSATDILLSKIAQVGANTVLSNPTTGTADISTTALSASNLVGRGSTGNVAAITVGGILSFSGTVLSATEVGTVSSVSGTTNRITVATGTSTPVIDISASYVGQSSITTLGTIATGVWQGTSISTTYTDAKIKTATGTLNRLTIGGTATDPTFDISTSYVGQATITTLGTISTGVWNGTDVAFANIAQLGANTVVTNATIGTADISTTALSTSNLLGRGSTGNIAAITVSGILSFSGTVLSATEVGTVSSVSGTTNRITVATGTSTPVIDISASYVGQSSITTLGTIGTGTWQGSSISTTYTDAKIKTVTGTTNRLTIGGTATDPTFDVSTSYAGQATIVTLGTVTTGTWNGTDVAFANVAQLSANSVATNPTTGAGDITSTALSASNLLGRGSTGNVAAITVGGILSFSGTVLSATEVGKLVHVKHGTQVYQVGLQADMNATKDTATISFYYPNLPALDSTLCINCDMIPISANYSDIDHNSKISKFNFLKKHERNISSSGTANWDADDSFGIVYLNNATQITYKLKASPTDREEVWVIVNTAAAGGHILDGNGHNINASATATVTTIYTVYHLFYSASLSKWLKIN